MDEGAIVSWFPRYGGHLLVSGLYHRLEIRGTTGITSAVPYIPRLSRVGSNLAGQVGSGRVGSGQLTQPDPREFRDVLIRPGDFENLLTRPDSSRHTPGDPRGAGFMRVKVDWTRDISHGSKPKSHRSKMSGYVRCSVGWSLVPRTFPGMSCSLFLLPALFAALRGVRAKNEKETATHAWALSHARSARPPGGPDERASYLCSLRPRQAA